MNKYEERLEKAQASLKKAQVNLENASEAYTSAAYTLPDLDSKSTTFEADSKALSDKLDSLSRNKSAAEHNIQVLENLVTDAEANKLKASTPHMPASLPDSGDGGQGNSDDGYAKAFFLSTHVKEFEAAVSSGDVERLYKNSTVMDIYGGNFLEVNRTQEKAFRQLLAGKGTGADSTKRALEKSYPHPKSIISSLERDVPVKEIKTAQVVGIAELGGFAVPPVRNNRILQKSMGLVAMRKAGAMRVTVTNSDTVDWQSVRSDSTIYSSGLRPAWIKELGPTNEQHITGQMKRIQVHDFGFHILTATKLLQMSTIDFDSVFDKLIAETKAIGEDIAFFIGDGINEPLGLLPNGANPVGYDNLVEVASGNATELTYDGIRALRHGINPQYRNVPTCFIGNDTSGLDIEQMKNGNGDYFVRDQMLNEGTPLLGGRWFSTEAMPPVAADNLPLAYGDMSGYMIVDSLNLRIGRFQDTTTGLNSVQIEVLSRVGGAVIEPWKIAVQKVSLA